MAGAPFRPLPAVRGRPEVVPLPCRCLARPGVDRSAGTDAALGPEASIDPAHQSWRWAFYAVVIPGLILATIAFMRSEPKAGSADVAFLIPRDLFNNQVGTFAKELVFINLLIRDCSEATTGKVESVDLKELSSSVPTVALAASARVVLALAKILNKFLDAWKRIEEIREVRGRLTKMGLKGVALEELTGQISTTVEEVVEESTSTLLIEYNGDSGRKNELSNALTQDMRRLFGQIERGLKIELHAEAKADEQDEVYLDD